MCFIKCSICYAEWHTRMDNGFGEYRMRYLITILSILTITACTHVKIESKLALCTDKNVNDLLLQGATIDSENVLAIPVLGQTMFVEMKDANGILWAESSEFNGDRQNHLSSKQKHNIAMQLCYVANHNTTDKKIIGK